MSNEQPTAAAPAAEPAVASQPATPAAPVTSAAAPAEPAATPAAQPAAAPAPPAAPVEYADFTAPEGVTLNADAVGSLKAFAKEKNLTQADAQKLVDIGLQATNAQKEAITHQI